MEIKCAYQRVVDAERGTWRRVKQECLSVWHMNVFLARGGGVCRQTELFGLQRLRVPKHVRDDKWSDFFMGSEKICLEGDPLP